MDTYWYTMQVCSFFYSKIYISPVSVGLRITIDHDDRSDNELQVICAAQTKAVCTCYKMISIVKLPIKLFLLPNEALLLQQVGPRSEKEYCDGSKRQHRFFRRWMQWRPLREDTSQRVISLLESQLKRSVLHNLRKPLAELEICVELKVWGLYLIFCWCISFLVTPLPCTRCLSSEAFIGASHSHESPHKFLDDQVTKTGARGVSFNMEKGQMTALVLWL